MSHAPSNVISVVKKTRFFSLKILSKIRGPHIHGYISLHLLKSESPKIGDVLYMGASCRWKNTVCFSALLCAQRLVISFDELFLVLLITRVRNSADLTYAQVIEFGGLPALSS